MANSTSITNKSIATIQNEMVNPSKFELMLERKKADREDFIFEQRFTEWLDIDRVERRTTYDSINYNPVYSEEFV